MLASVLHSLYSGIELIWFRWHIVVVVVVVVVWKQFESVNFLSYGGVDSVSERHKWVIHWLSAS